MKNPSATTQSIMFNLRSTAESPKPRISHTPNSDAGLTN
jgi:hypothetical protein